MTLRRVFFTRFFKENSNKKSVGPLRGRTFGPSSCLKTDKNDLLTGMKLILSGGIELNPVLAEIPFLLTYGRRFTCSSSTYFWFLFALCFFFCFCFWFCFIRVSLIVCLQLYKFIIIYCENPRWFLLTNFINFGQYVPFAILHSHLEIGDFRIL